jgi:hypothetical protein
MSLPVSIKIDSMRASPGLVCHHPAKIPRTSKFKVIYFFPTPPINLKRNGYVMGTAYMWGLLIANHLDQSLCLANTKQGAAVRSYLLHSSLAGAQQSCMYLLPTSERKLRKKAEHICRSKTIFLS